MIQTEEQRRWWFANHPEFSSKREGGKSRRNRAADSDNHKIDPRDVDAYVDEALKYESGTVAELLKIVKQVFGTEAELSKEQHRLEAWEKILEDGWGTPAGAYGDGDLYISEYPRMPTTDELLRWPRELAKRFYRWLDNLIQNNPLIIDPDALETHHRLPREFIDYFLDCGLTIADYLRVMRAADHRLKPEGVHAGEGKGGRYNTLWREKIEDWPRENTKEQQKRKGFFE